MAELTLVTSWDDGHPADRRLAERLARLGIAATFFVPVSNSEGRPTMTAQDWRALDAAGFEIAAHTHDHVRLTALSPARALQQMVDGRRRLEDGLGHGVPGFAYPGGRMGRDGRRLAAAAGFAYARTTRMFCLDPGSDPLSLSTTAQFHPHAAGAVLRNWLRQGGGSGRFGLAWRWLRAGSLDNAMAAMADAAAACGGVLHLWGHAWEIEESGLWPVLERVMTMLAERTPPAQRITVQALAARQFRCDNMSS